MMNKTSFLKRILTLSASITLILVGFTQTQAEKTHLSITLAISRIAWSHDASLVAVGWGTNWCIPDHPDIYNIGIFDAQTHQITQSLSGSTCGITALDWSPDDTKLAAASLDSVGMRVWDIETGQLVTTAQRGGQGAADVKWRPDGRELAVLGTNNGGAIFDAATGEFLENLPIGGVKLDWNPAGDKLVAASFFENSLGLADMITRRRIMVLEGHSTVGGDVDWSPDGTKIASAGGYGDPTVRVWDAATGENLLVLSAASYQVRWSPDSKRLASANEDGTVLIWDGSTGEQIVEFHDRDEIHSVDWNPDGTEIVYGGEGGGLCFRLVPTIDTTEISPYCELSPEELSQIEG